MLFKMALSVYPQFFFEKKPSICYFCFLTLTNAFRFVVPIIFERAHLNCSYATNLGDATETDISVFDCNLDKKFQEKKLNFVLNSLLFY